MIQFTLKCADGHRFDSWFQSAAAFDKLHAAGMVSCAICGNTQVEKAIMAPRVQASRSRDGIPDPKPQTAPEPPQATPAEQALAEFKRHVEANSEYVGVNFAREARDMHDGLTPERSIYGEAKPEDARKLIEEGIPVAPLPFVPGRKSN